MILINLLPPELRRRRSTGTINPLFAGAVGGGVLVVLMAGSWFWLKYSRLPFAEQTRDGLTDTLNQKTAEAKRVTERKNVIVEFEKRRDNLFALLNRKVYWARTLDDFGNLLTGQWSIDGFQVRAQELVIAELAAQAPKPGEGAKKGEEVRCSFRWTYKILGDEDRSGDYINSFFKTVEHGNFWADNDFVGKPDQRYVGDRPRWNADLQKVVVEGSLDWQRVKNTEEEKARILALKELVRGRTPARLTVPQTGTFRSVPEPERAVLDAILWNSREIEQWQRANPGIDASAKILEVLARYVGKAEVR